MTNYFNFNSELIVNDLKIERNLELSHQMIILRFKKMTLCSYHGTYAFQSESCSMFS